MSKKLIYLDHAAATPMSKAVRSAMEPYFTEQFYNPSATYLPAQKVRNSLSQARADVASVLGARPAEVIFTAGATEANNMAIYGIMSRFPDANIVVSAVEHESVLAPAGEYDVRIALVDNKGQVDLASLEKLIDKKTALVSVMYANNEVGTIQPIREIAQLVADKRIDRKKGDLPLYFHTDAAQAPNYLDLHVSRLGVDMLSLNGSKIYGPKQSGALFVKAGIELTPLVLGGGQESGLRSGTENVAGSIGFATALKETTKMRDTELKRIKDLQKHFFKQLDSKIPEAMVSGSLKKRLPNNVHIILPGTDNERILLQLEQAGVLAAAGSACSASNEEPSHVLGAMGCSEAEAQSSLRFSLGRSTTKADIDTTVDTLVKLFV